MYPNCTDCQHTWWWRWWWWWMGGGWRPPGPAGWAESTGSTDSTGSVEFRLHVPGATDPRRARQRAQQRAGMHRLPAPAQRGAGELGRRPQPPRRRRGDGDAAAPPHARPAAPPPRRGGTRRPARPR
eukprot:gene5858-biopygen2798